MKNGIRVAICVLLVVAVLAMSLSVFADNADTIDDDTLIEINEQLAVYYVWYTMQAMGIDVTVGDVEGFTDEVNNWLLNKIYEFFDTLPSAYTLSTWVAPWQATADYWGNFMGNESMLEDITEFADWLVRVMALQNDQTVVVGYGDYIQFWNGVKYYPIKYSPILYGNYNILYDYNGATCYGYASGSNPSGVTYYIAFSRDNRHSVISLQNDAILSYYWVTIVPGQTGGTTVQEGHRTNNSIYNNMSTYPFYYSTSNTYHSANLIPYNDMADTYDDLLLALTGQFEEKNDDIEIITGTIDTPDDTTGKTIKIIDGGYDLIEIEWPSSISVDNLPAIVSTGTVANPGLEAFWGFIPVLAEQTKDAIVLTRGLIYELPEELVVTFYAVMGGLILFGIIKLMREH